MSLKNLLSNLLSSGAILTVMINMCMAKSCTHVFLNVNTPIIIIKKSNLIFDF